MPKHRVKKLLVDFGVDPLVSQHRWFRGTLVPNPVKNYTGIDPKPSFFFSEIFFFIYSIN